MSKLLILLLFRRIQAFRGLILSQIGESSSCEEGKDRHQSHQFEKCCSNRGVQWTWRVTSRRRRTKRDFRLDTKWVGERSCAEKLVNTFKMDLPNKLATRLFVSLRAHSTHPLTRDASVISVGPIRSTNPSSNYSNYFWWLTEDRFHSRGHERLWRRLK